MGTGHPVDLDGVHATGQIADVVGLIPGEITGPGRPLVTGPATLTGHRADVHTGHRVTGHTGHTVHRA